VQREEWVSFEKVLQP
jgi:hypothetical protein